MSTKLAADALSAQSQILSRLAQGKDVANILAPLLELVEENIPGAICSIMERDVVHQTLRVFAAPGAPPLLVKQLNGLTPGRPATSCGMAAHTGKPVLVEDAQQDERWFPFRELAKEFGIGSSWSIPLLNGEGDQVCGTFAITRALPGLPDSSQERLLLLGSEVARLLLMRAQEKQELARKDMIIEAILRQCEDPIYIKDSERRYLLVNEAESRGLRDSPEEFRGLRDEEIYEGETLRNLRRTDLEVLTSGKPVSFVEEIINPVRGSRFYHMRKSPLLDSHGSVIGILGTARDLTDLRQKKGNRDCSKRLEGIGLIAGGIAHDFNNVLTAIGGNLDLIEMSVQVGSPEDLSIKAAIKAAIKATEQATQLVGQLLAVGQGIDSQDNNVDLCSIVRDVLELVRREIPEGVRVEFDPVPHSLQMVGNPVQLLQLVMNLVLNAAEAVEPRKGRILVRVRQERAVGQSACLVLTVIDNGRGMDAQTRQRIFSPFFTTKEEGSGIGMTVVQTVLDAHQGELQISSQSGKGTELRVAFPFSMSVAGSPVSAAPSGPSPLRDRRILIVDDDPSVLLYSKRALELAGARTCAVEGTDHALAALGADSDFDAIVLDLSLPEVAGDELCTVIRRKWPTLPILLISGGSPDAHEIQQTKASSTRFLSKPFRVNELQSELRDLIQVHSRDSSAAGL